MYGLIQLSLERYGTSLDLTESIIPPATLRMYISFSGLFLRTKNCEMRGLELPSSNEVLCNSFVFLKSECFAIAQKLLTLFLEDRVFYHLLCLLYILK